MARKAKRVRKAMIQRAGDQVSAEVVLSSESGSSMFETGAVLTANNLDRYKPPGGRGMETARVLQELGFPNPVVSSATEKKAELTGESGVKMRGPYEWVPPQTPHAERPVHAPDVMQWRVPAGI